MGRYSERVKGKTEIKNYICRTNSSDMTNSFNIEMTHNQFVSINNYLNSFDIVTEIINTPKFKKLRKRKDVDINEIKKWMFNGWNSERVLRETNQLFKNKDNSFVLQWSFPQSYYSVFQLTLSFIYLIRDTKISHKSIIDRYGELIKYNWYPNMVSFYSDGTINNSSFENIKFNNNTHSIKFIPTSLDSCQIQICQFLKSTRKILLNEEKVMIQRNKKYKTKDGKSKSRLNEIEWREISDKLEVTSILSLLYRKRIMSNYKDIDTFSTDNNLSGEINNSLIGIVSTMNLIHETYICKIIGKSKYLQFYNEFTKGVEISFLKDRLKLIIETI